MIYRKKIEGLKKMILVLSYYSEVKLANPENCFFILMFASSAKSNDANIKIKKQFSGSASLTSE